MNSGVEFYCCFSAGAGQSNMPAISSTSWCGLSEPKMEQRNKVGLIVISYLLILAIILYLSMKQIWARVK